MLCVKCDAPITETDHIYIVEAKDGYRFKTAFCKKCTERIEALIASVLGMGSIRKGEGSENTNT